MAAGHLIPDVYSSLSARLAGALQSGVDLFPEQLAQSVEDDLAESRFNSEGLR
jgi:hypothetical protein